MAEDQKVYMPLMIGDWLKGTRGMKAEVRGVYINLLLYQWDNGYLPSDWEELCLIDPELPKVWDKIKDKFPEIAPGKLQNKKNKEVREFWAKQKKNGKLGGRPPGSKSTKYISPEKLDWEEMISFFDNSCLCCGHKFPEDQRPTKDHIIPQISGGPDDISNYQPLCRQCNSSKHATHTTDYRLKFIAKIPKELREKWFKKNPELTQNKPKNESKKNHHNDLDIDLDNESDFRIEFKEGSGEKTNVTHQVTQFPVEQLPGSLVWCDELYREKLHRLARDKGVSDLENLRDLWEGWYVNKFDWRKKDLQEMRLSFESWIKDPKSKLKIKVNGNDTGDNAKSRSEPATTFGAL